MIEQVRLPLVSTLQTILISDILEYTPVYCSLGSYANLTFDHNLTGFVDIDQYKGLVILYPNPSVLDETRFKTLLPVLYSRAERGIAVYEAITAILGSWSYYFPTEN